MLLFNIGKDNEDLVSLPLILCLYILILCFLTKKFSSYRRPLKDSLGNRSH